MSAKPQKAAPSRKGKDKKNALFPKIDLPAHISNIKKEDAWTKNDRNAITVFKTGDMTIILVAMHKNAGLINHTAESITSLQVLEGNLTFETDGQSVELAPGSIVAVHEGIKYSIKANEVSAFLLTSCTIKQAFL
jgi:quercetin dioxygenase-like cupin family protein